MGELVLVAGRDPTRHAGGAESYMVAYARAAQLAGYEPHMFVVGRRGETRDEVFGKLHVVASPVELTIGHLSAVHRSWLLRALVRFLRDRRGPHVLHAHVGWTRIASDAAAELATIGVEARVLGSFYSSVEHEQRAKNRAPIVRSSPTRRVQYALALAWVHAAAVPNERHAYRRADVVAVNYDSVRRLLREAYGERPDVQRIAYCAPQAFRADAGFRERPAAGPGRPPLIVAVSRHSPRKGLDVLIRALAQLRARRIPFCAQLVGRGPMLRAHQRLVREFGLEAQVALPGVVPDPLPFLRACEVFVLPSLQEDSGSVSVLEAMQIGAPIVASAVDGIPEDLTDERSALLVAPGNAPELCNALARLLGEDQLRRRLSLAARATYEARFTPDRVAADLARVYMGLGLTPG